MKFLLLAIIGFCSFFIFGCNNDGSHSKLTREDSLRIYEAMNKSEIVKKVQSEKIFVAKNFNLRESKPIDSSKAQMYLDNYFNTCLGNGENPGDIIKAFKIDRKAFGSILQDKRCVAVRMYLGKETPGVPLSGDYTIIVVGVDSTGRNLKKNIWDESSPCPRDCPDDADLAKP